jgi:hypothetical protein
MEPWLGHRRFGEEVFFAGFQEVSLRLGIALFTVGVLHGLNILAVSVFHRKSTA